jgi:hypothetical protein
MVSLVMFQKINRDGAPMGPVAIAPKAIKVIVPGPYGVLLEPGKFEVKSSIIEVNGSDGYYLVAGTVEENMKKANDA